MLNVTPLDGQLEIKLAISVLFPVDLLPNVTESWLHYVANGLTDGLMRP